LGFAERVKFARLPAGSFATITMVCVLAWDMEPPGEAAIDHKDGFMRIAVAALAAFLAMSGLANAASDEGQITAIDGDAMTITLDNGNTYRLPGEFNMEAIDVGTEVLIAFDQIDGQRQITDMDIME